MPENQTTREQCPQCNRYDVENCQEYVCAFAPASDDIDALTGCADDQSELGQAIAKGGDIAVRHAIKIIQLASLLREARNSRAADTVPNGWADRVDEALQP